MEWKYIPLVGNEEGHTFPNPLLLLMFFIGMLNDLLFENIYYENKLYHSANNFDDSGTNFFFSVFKH